MAKIQGFEEKTSHVDAKRRMSAFRRLECRRGASIARSKKTNSNGAPTMLHSSRWIAAAGSAIPYSAARPLPRSNTAGRIKAAYKRVSAAFLHSVLAAACGSAHSGAGATHIWCAEYSKTGLTLKRGNGRNTHAQDEGTLRPGNIGLCRSDTGSFKCAGSRLGSRRRSRFYIAARRPDGGRSHHRP